MTDDEYTTNMLVIQRAFETMTKGLNAIVSDEQLDVMRKTVSLADTMSFVMVKPLDYAKTTLSLKKQGKMLEMLAIMREDMREITEED